jgi:hypothetical protein
MTGIEKSRNSKTRFVKGCDLTKIERLEWFFVLDHVGHTQKGPMDTSSSVCGIPYRGTEESMRLKGQN